MHTETLDAVTRYLGLGSYAQWDEETRMSWLNTELTAKRPLLPHVRAWVAACSLSWHVVDPCMQRGTCLTPLPPSLNAHTAPQPGGQGLQLLPRRGGLPRDLPHDR